MYLFLCSYKDDIERQAMSRNVYQFCADSYVLMVILLIGCCYMHSTDPASSNHLKTYNSRQNWSRTIRCLVRDLSREVSCSINRGKYLPKK